MNVNHAKFQKKFDSRTISRELPAAKTHCGMLKAVTVKFHTVKGKVSRQRPIVGC